MVLDRLYVHPTWWGKRIGSTLHDAAVEAAANHGAQALNQWVLEANTRARGFYQRRGWRLVPRWTLPNDPPSVVDLLYQLTLSRAQPHHRTDGPLTRRHRRPVVDPGR